MKRLCLLLLVLLLVAPVSMAQYREFFWSQTGGGPEGGYLYDVEVASPHGNLVFLATEDAGVFRSKDGGQVWDKAGLYDLTVRTVAIHPVYNDIVYAGTWDGRIYKSMDAGDSWTEQIKGLGGDAIMDMVVHPSDPDTVFAGTYGDGIFISYDAGESWVASNDGLSDTYINRIIVDPNDADVLYAGVYTDNVPLNVSTDRGLSWQSLSNGLPNSTCRDIDVYEGNSDIIFLALEGDYMWRSQDGGQSWEQMNSDEGFTDSNAYTVRLHPSDPLIAWGGSRYHGGFKTIDGGDNWIKMVDDDFDPYIRFLALDPSDPDKLFMGNQDGSGVYISTDGGSTWQSSNEGFTNLNIQCLAIHPDVQNLLYAGTRGRGVFRSTDYGRTWEERNVQLGPQNIYCLATAELEVYAGTSSGIYRGLDGGNIWAELTEGIDYSDDIYCIAINPSNASNIILGSNSVEDGSVYMGGVYYTTNRGEEWVGAHIDSSADGSVTVRDLVFAEPSGRMYAATSNGVYRSDNSGESWSQTNYIYHDVRAVAFDSKNGGRVYAASKDGIYISQNSGASWDLMVGFIEAVDMAVDESRTPSWIYAVADTGVFVSDDNGINWATSNYGLTNRHVETIVIDPFDPEIAYVGTQGSGVFTTADATPPEIPSVIAAIPLDGGVRITWQLGTENDLAGYRVYYDIDEALPPFNGLSAVQGTSPIDIGLETSLDLHGFSNGQPVYVAVTAYDDVGNESYYSDVQTVIPNGQPVMVMAGYGDTYLTQSGGNLDIIAWAMDADGDVIESIGLYYGGMPMDFPLPSVGDGVFMTSIPMPAGISQFSQIFELVATDENGSPSGLWPYLNVRQTAWTASANDYSYWEQPPVIAPWWFQRSRPIADPPDGNGPFVFAAGYNMTRVSTDSGGQLNLIAIAIDNQDNITGVELFVSGLSTGVFLKDDGKSGDFAAGDNVYGINFDIPAGSMAANDWLLELKAYNNAGQESDLWPYLTVR